MVVAAVMHTVTNGALSLPLEFFRDNFLGVAHRQMLMGFALGSAAIVVGVGAVAVSRDPARTLSALEWLVRLLCPAIVLPLLLGLVRHDFGSDIEAALLLALFVIGFERLLRISLVAWAERPPRPAPLAPLLPARALKAAARLVVRFFESPRLVLAAVVLLAIGHGLYMGTWAVWSHQRFSTYGYDLGQYDQIFANTLHGNWLAVSTLGEGWAHNWGELNGHADFGTFYMLPFYALHPRATTLLIMQATMLAGATIPLYLFAKNRLPAAIAFGVALAWLLYAPMHGAQLYDVHMQPFGAAWAICAICAVDYKKWVLYWVFFVLAILCREDVSIGLTVLGLLLALSGHRFKTGLATAAIATTYFVGLRFFMMKNAMFAEVFKGLYAPGEAVGFGSIIKTLISNPVFVFKSLVDWEKVRYFAQLFAPLAFLPLRRPALWLLCIPGFILTLLSTKYMPTVQISFQYVSNWAAYMVPATAVVLSLFPNTVVGRSHRNAAAVALLIASMVGSIQWGAYSPRQSIRGGFADVPFKAPSELDKQREKDLQVLVAKVPKEVRLCTSDRIQPHATWFLNMWSLKDALYDCEYLLFSDLPGDLGNDRGLSAIASGAYEVIERSASGLTFAKKKAPVPPPAAPAPVPSNAP